MSPLLERASCSFIATQMSRTLDWSSICSSDHKTRVKFLEAVANWSSITYPPSHSVRPANMSLVPLYVVCSHSCFFFSSGTREADKAIRYRLVDLRAVISVPVCNLGRSRRSMVSGFERIHGDPQYPYNLPFYR